MGWVISWWLFKVMVKFTQNRGKVMGRKTRNLTILRRTSPHPFSLDTTSPGNSGCGCPNLGCLSLPAGLSWLCRLYVLPQTLGFGLCVDGGVQPSEWQVSAPPQGALLHCLHQVVLTWLLALLSCVLSHFPKTVFIGPRGLGLNVSFMNMESPQYCLPLIYFLSWLLSIFSVLMLIPEKRPVSLSH